MDKDAAQVRAALSAEAAQVAYRKSLLAKVEDLWAIDPKFRSAIRGLIKNSGIKDKRGNKSGVDIDLTQSMLKLGMKLGLTKTKVLEEIAQTIEPESINKALARGKKKPGQGT